MDGFSIGRYDKKRESFGLSAASFESGTLQFSRESRSSPGAVQKNSFHPCPSIKRTANPKSFKRAHNTTSEAKGRQFTLGKVL